MPYAILCDLSIFLTHLFAHISTHLNFEKKSTFVFYVVLLHHSNEIFLGILNLIPFHKGPIQLNQKGRDQVPHHIPRGQTHSQAPHTTEGEDQTRT